MPATGYANASFYYLKLPLSDRLNNLYNWQISTSKRYIQVLYHRQTVILF
ncbi:MAG: hypothetical protein V7K35_24860 [Nostoc sp.]